MSELRPEAALRSIERGPQPTHSIRITADRILVAQPTEVGERRTRGGILIPATADSETRRAIWGEVVAVGPLVRSTEPGDRVLFPPDTGFEVEIRQEDYMILRERDVHAVASERVEGTTGLYL
jgi:chaperonin GroES